MLPEHLNQALVASGIGIVELTCDGVIRSLTSPACEILGGDESSLIGKPWREFVCPKDLVRGMQDMAAVAEGATGPLHTVGQIVRLDGTIRWANIHITAMADATTGVTLTAVLRDVTDAVEMEQAYQLLAEQTSEVVFRSDAAGRLRWVSPSVTKVTGWTPRQVMGIGVTDLVHPADLEANSQILAALNTGDDGEGRARIRFANGDYQWVRFGARSVTDEKGDVIGHMGGFRSIQDEIEYEQALTESEEQYRLLAENSSDVVFLVGRQGHISWVSPAIEQTLGWNSLDLIGSNVSTLLAPGDRLRAEQRLQEIMRLGRGLHDTDPLLRVALPDGTHRWVTGKATPVTAPSGEVVGCVIAMNLVDGLIDERNSALDDATQSRESLTRALNLDVIPRAALRAIRDYHGQIIDFRIHALNTAAVETLNLDYEECMTRTFLDVMPDHRHSGVFEAYTRVVETGEPYESARLTYFNETRGAVHRAFTVRAVKVGDGLVTTWHELTTAWPPLGHD